MVFQKGSSEKVILKKMMTKNDVDDSISVERVKMWTGRENV